MTQDQMVQAIVTALQTADANGEFSNVVLLMQAQLISWVPNASVDQLQSMCQILNINTSVG
jgi:hypothetical protein